MSKKPKISVLMSVYNGALYLADAIESILKQTFHDFEFIIINDGSTDDSLNVIKSYRDDRIVCVDSPKEGLISALNKGINMARGDLIARMDADDISMPERLFTQYLWLKKNPDVGVLGAGCRFIDSKGNLSGKIINSGGSHDAVLRKILDLQEGPPLMHPTVMMRKNIALRAGGYNERFPVCEDMDLWLRIAGFSRLQVIPDVLLLHRRTNDNVSSTKRSTQLLSGVLARICYYMRNHNLGDPSCRTSDQWSEFRILADKTLEQNKVYYADKTRMEFSRELFMSKGLAGYVELFFFMVRNPGLIWAIQYKMRWKKTINDILRVAVSKEEG